jgi:sucrose phosphorylase
MLLLNNRTASRIQSRLARLYPGQGPRLWRRFQHLIGRYGVGEAVQPHSRYWDENSVVLISYADMVRARDQRPLQSLRAFLKERVGGLVSIVHLLPFTQWSSDDGFSVVDYRAVDPRYGRWEDVGAIGEDYQLAFDLVLNHCSRGSRWFRDFVTGIAPARWYFLPMDPSADLSAVVRPRPTPLLTRTATRDGDTWVWTTFSEDQVDLNWRNPDVLFEFLDILFLYLARGCRVFRLDAVAFLWKEPGTDCLHRPETHEVVKLFRDVVDLVAPDAVLLTETNVPHAENIAYFGDGDEAHMVYNFSLPPLLLHALLRGDARHLRAWAAGLPELAPGQTFLNFTASHDGIGVRPLQGLLDPAEIDWLVAQVKKRGGLVSERDLGGGRKAPYELNITYRDALAEPGAGELGIARFLCSQALLLALRGVPAVYFHSLVGTPNDRAAARSSGHNRAINRRKWARVELDAALDDRHDPQARIFARYTQMLRRRRDHPAFHPDAPQQVLDTGDGVFAFLRSEPGGGERIACVFNLQAEPVQVPFAMFGPGFNQQGPCRDILNGVALKTGARRNLALEPYQACWLLAQAST